METCNECTKQVATNEQCESCHYLNINKQIEPGNIDKACASDDVTCPWCGVEQGYSTEFSEGNHECGTCGNEFELRIEYSVDYTAERVGENWIEAEYVNKTHCLSGGVCQ